MIKVTNLRIDTNGDECSDNRPIRTGADITEVLLNCKGKVVYTIETEGDREYLANSELLKMKSFKLVFEAFINKVFYPDKDFKDILLGKGKK